MSVEAGASDAQLADAARSGSDAAFSELIRRHKDALFRVLRSHVGNPDEAYEALQEAFIAAWQALERYDRDRPFGAWLRTIALNKARDRARRRWVRRLILGAVDLDSAEARAVSDSAGSPETASLQHERQRRIERWIATLPSILKEALILTAVDGLSHAEAAELLGVTAKTVEMRAYRARKLLAQRIDADLLSPEEP